MKNDFRIATGDQLKKIVLQESLIDKAATLRYLENITCSQNTTDIFFGTGISRPGEVSCGIPLDFLMYPLLANRIRNKAGSGHIHHLIADNHALLNGLDSKVVKKVAVDYRHTMEGIIGRLGIENYNIYLSSEIATDNYYKALGKQASAIEFLTEYARLEAMDIQYFFKTRNVILKLGWKFKGESKYDESKFDDQYVTAFGNNVIPVYTTAGKKFTDKQFDTVPYTVYEFDIDKRLLLSEKENITQKITVQNCSQQTMKTLQNHYSAIIRLFEYAVGKIPEHTDTWGKMNYINHFLTTK